MAPTATRTLSYSRVDLLAHRIARYTTENVVIALAKDSRVTLLLREIIFSSDDIIYNITNIIMAFIHPLQAGFFGHMARTMGSISNVPVPYSTSKKGKVHKSAHTNSPFYVGKNNIINNNKKNGSNK
tara:strand:- start:38 stop:418 length:381 start_codon:yes stop_codon:yes gene_type:complete